METTVNNKRVDNYFSFLKHWDTESKKNLIIRLTKSIDNKSKDKYDFSSCFGLWDDKRTADEIIDDLRSDRVDNCEMEEF